MNDLPNNLKPIVTRDYHISNQKISLKRYIDFDNVDNTISEFETLSESCQFDIIKYLICTNNFNFIEIIVPKIVKFNINAENGILLKLSVVNGQLENFSFLINIGADLTIDNNIIGKLAAQESSVEFLDLILKYANVSNIDELLVYTAISRIDVLSKIKLLEDYGINIHIYDDYAFVAAVQKTDTKTVEYLLSKGCDVGTQQNIALKYSVWYNFLPITKLLLQAGATTRNLQVEDLIDVIGNKHYEMIELLIQYGLDLNIFDNYFEKTRNSDAFRTIKTLVDYGVSPIDLLAVCLYEHH
ncbi:ankyrin repeat protein [Bandra megavirus]|uniref:Ankyrin repeat protein n=1 Tax=Bandra megavirus TaxID=2071566 RepID=A0A2K9V8X4_9VIRU|nr:ankyrin repeat protein [Bandra megavirus]